MAKPISSSQEDQTPKKVGLRIGAIVGGFVLFIIVVGWIYLALQK